MRGRASKSFGLKPLWAAALAVALATLSAAALWFAIRGDQSADPDYFYHVGLSRWSLEHGLPSALPQITGLGWDQQFTDKEFLFHRVTTAAYAIGGERAVALVPLLAWAALVALVVGAVALESGPVAAGLAGSILIASSFLPYRFTLVRPHALAVPLFIGLFLALRSGRERWAAAFAALFALAYHALQVPLLLIGVWLVTAALERRPRGRSYATPAAWAICGLIVGTLVNPYFPGTLVMSLQHARIAFDLAGGAQLPYGAELHPVSSSSFVLQNLLPLALLITSWTLNSGFATLACAAFWILSALSPRGLEYALPLTALLALELPGLARLPGRRAQFAALALVAAFVAQTALFSGWMSRTRIRDDVHPELIAALRAIPATPTGALVANCYWEMGAAILYARPDLKFLDLLDPSLLQARAPELAAARAQLCEGGIVDAYGLLHDVFGASYVVAERGALTAQLESDARFQRVVPVDAAQAKAARWQVYELRAPAPRLFVTAFDVTVVGSARREPDRQAQWHALQFGDRSAPSFLDLRQVAAGRGLAASTCFAVRPHAGQLTAFRGARQIGIGGGPVLAAWADGRRLFAPEQPLADAKLVQSRFDLPHPLRGDERVTLLVCPDAGARYYGAALSFWP